MNHLKIHSLEAQAWPYQNICAHTVQYGNSSAPPLYLIWPFFFRGIKSPLDNRLVVPSIHHLE